MAINLVKLAARKPVRPVELILTVVDIAKPTRGPLRGSDSLAYGGRQAMEDNRYAQRTR